MTFHKSFTYKALASKTEIDKLRQMGNTKKKTAADKSLLMRNIYISGDGADSTLFSKTHKAK